MGNSMFRNLIQIGIVVSDLEKTLAYFEKVLGIGPFRIAEYPPADLPDCKRTYHGQPADFQAKFCFFQFDNIELEVIQPIAGDNIWSDFLREKGPGLHHLKFLVDTHKESEEHFAQQGIEMIASGDAIGPNKGKSWRYYDTTAIAGFFTEMMNEIVE